MKILELKWKYDQPPHLSEDELATLKMGLNEIEEAVNYDASTLLFHTIFLEENHEGASVTLWGSPNDKKTINAVYSRNTKWVTANDELDADI